MFYSSRSHVISFIVNLNKSFHKRMIEKQIDQCPFSFQSIQQYPNIFVNLNLSGHNCRIECFLVQKLLGLLFKYILFYLPNI